MVAYHLLSFLALSGYYGFCIARCVFVSNEGDDIPSCGSREIPCKSIANATDQLSPLDLNATIILSRSSTYFLNSPIHVHMNNAFSLIGEDQHVVIKANLPNQNLLKISEVENGTDRFSITIRNIRFEKVKCSKVLFINVGLSKNIDIKISETNFVEVEGSPLYIKVTNPGDFFPDANIIVENCKFINNALTVANDTYSRGLLHINLVKCNNTAIKVVKTHFSENKISGADLGLKKVCFGVMAIETHSTNLLNFTILDSTFKQGGNGSICVDVEQSNIVEIYKVNVNVSNNDGIKGGGLDITAVETELRLFMRSIRYEHNIATIGGALTLFCHKLEHGKIEMSDVISVDNEARSYGGSFSIRLNESADMSIKMQKLLHRNNKAGTSGGAIYFDSISSGRVILDIDEANFEGNTAKYHGGAIKFSITESNGFIFNLKQVKFIKNKANINGGAIMFREQTNKKSEMGEISIISSRFTNNSAQSMGGAIIFDSLKSNIRKHLIKQSQFKYNKANLGGCLVSKGGSLSVLDCNFFSNQGAYGGTLYLRGDHKNRIANCQFESSIQNMIDITTPIDISNTQYHVFVDSIDGRSGADVFRQYDSSSIVRSPFNVTCPISYHIKGRYSRFVSQKGSTEMVDKEKLAYHAVTCTPCDKGTYNIQRMTYWYDKGSKGYSSDNISPSFCKPCPTGGDCGQGILRSLPNYWGYQKGNNIHLIHCPLGYCDTNSYNSCAHNREGLLCGTCTENHSLSFWSSSCIPYKNVSSRTILFRLFLALPFILWIIFMLLDDIKRLTRKFFNKLCKDNNEDSFWFSRIRFLFSFYQLQRFTKAPSVKYTSAEQLQQILGTIFSLNTLNAESSFVDSISPSPSRNFNYLHKQLINMFLWIYPTILCIILYAIISIVMIVIKRKKCLKNFDLKLLRVRGRLDKSFIQLISISFIPIATSLFNLIRCTQIYDKEKGTNVSILFSQGNITCFCWWQIIIMVVIAIWIVPLAGGIFVATKLLERGKITLSLITIFFPPVALYAIFNELINCRNKVFKSDNYEKAENQDSSTLELETRVNEDASTNVLNTPSGTNDRRRKSTNENETMIDNSVINVQDNTFNDVLNTNEKDDQTNHKHRMQHVNCLLDVINKPYRTKQRYWASVRKLKDMLLVCIFVFVDFIAFRLYVLGLVLMLYLLAIIFIRPYKNRVLNWLDLSYIMLLLVLDLMSIFDVMKVYHFPQTDESKMLHEAFSLLKLIILVLPVILLIIFSVIDRLVCKETSSGIQDPLNDEPAPKPEFLNEQSINEGIVRRRVNSIENNMQDFIE